MLNTKFLLFCFMVLLSSSELHAENEENEGNKYSPLTGLYKKFAGGVQKIAKDLIDQSDKKDKPAPVDGAQEEKPKEESKVEPKDDSVSHDEWADSNLSDGYRDQPSWDDQLRDGVYRDRPDRDGGFRDWDDQLRDGVFRDRPERDGGFRDWDDQLRDGVFRDRPDRDGGFRDWDDQLRDGIDRDIGFRDQLRDAIKHDCVRDGISWDNQVRDGVYRDRPDRDRRFRDQTSWDDQLRDGVYRDRPDRDGGNGFRDGLRDFWVREKYRDTIQDSPLRYVRDGGYGLRDGLRDAWDSPLRDGVYRNRPDRDDGLFGFRDTIQDSPLGDGAYRDAIAHRADIRDQYYWDWDI